MLYCLPFAKWSRAYVSFLFSMPPQSLPLRSSSVLYLPGRWLSICRFLCCSFLSCLFISCHLPCYWLPFRHIYSYFPSSFLLSHVLLLSCPIPPSFLLLLPPMSPSSTFQHPVHWKVNLSSIISAHDFTHPHKVKCTKLWMWSHTKCLLAFIWLL